MFPLFLLVRKDRKEKKKENKVVTLQKEVRGGGVWWASVKFSLIINYFLTFISSYINAGEVLFCGLRQNEDRINEDTGRMPDIGLVMSGLILYAENFSHNCYDLHWYSRTTISPWNNISDGTNFEGNESCCGWRRRYLQTSTGRELEECLSCTAFAVSW